MTEYLIICTSVFWPLRMIGDASIEPRRSSCKSIEKVVEPSICISPVPNLSEIGNQFLVLTTLERCVNFSKIDAIFPFLHAVMISFVALPTMGLILSSLRRIYNY